MELIDYITENSLILIPALYVLGMIIKNTESIQDKYIPVLLLIFGIAGCIALMGFTADAVIQGVLVTGASVYANQLLKQSNK